jgi:putative endonuclease
MKSDYYVYAIHSIKHKIIYVGLSTDPEKRLRDHNYGMTKSTKPYRPWSILYKEKIGSRIDARKREKYLKSGIGKEFLKTLLNMPL